MTRYASHVRDRMNTMRAAAIHGLMEKPGSIKTTATYGRVSCIVRWARCGSRDLFRFSWHFDGRCVRAGLLATWLSTVSTEPVVSTTYLEGFGA